MAGASAFLVFSIACKSEVAAIKPEDAELKGPRPARSCKSVVAWFEFNFDPSSTILMKLSAYYKGGRIGDERLATGGPCFVFGHRTYVE